MKVHFALPRFSDFRDFEVDVIEKICAEFRNSRCVDHYELSDSAEAADLILFLESATFKPRSHIANLCREPLLQRYAGKLLTYNYQDGAAGFLDGIYVHTERRRFIPSRHKAWSTLWPHNELIYTVDDAEIEKTSPIHLCSFRGSISSYLRKRIVEYYRGKADRGFCINLVNRWYDHAQDEKRSYIDEILQSRFVLCPKGVCSYTPRFFETMALGRVPVLLADDWVPPENLDVDAVAIRVREKDFAHIEDIVRSRESHAAEMGRQGRIYWKTYFSQDVRLKALIDVAVACLDQQTVARTLEAYIERWRSLPFAWANDWTVMQRAGRRIQHRLFSNR